MSNEEIIELKKGPMREIQSLLFHTAPQDPVSSVFKFMLDSQQTKIVSREEETCIAEERNLSLSVRINQQSLPL